MNLSNMLKKCLILCLLVGGGGVASAQMMINGAGATFPYPIYSKWFDEYAKVDPSVRFNYQSIGSGGGQKQILAQTVDFGASDGPMSDENLAKAPAENSSHSHRRRGRRGHLQSAGQSNAEIRRRDHCRNLPRQDQEVERPEDRRANPGVKLPDQEIVVVHRSDGSGTTYISPII